MRGALRKPPRFAQFALAPLALRQVAEHGKEIQSLRLGAAHGHRERDQATSARAAAHLATVLLQVRSAWPFQAFEVLIGNALALRRQQRAQIALREFGAIVAE